MIQSSDIRKVLYLIFNFATMIGAVIIGKSITEHFVPSLVVHPKDGLHEVRKRMLSKIGGDISDA